MSQSQPEQIRAPDYEVTLPPLHRKQQEVFLHPARFKVVVCGRQWGKTFLAAVTVFARALQGEEVWWVAPAYHQAEYGWRKVKQMARQIPGTEIKERPDYRVTFPTGGTVQVKSADNVDLLRGATLDGIVMDEAAMMKEEAWLTVEPTLAIRDGWALFISTPKGTNWFHDLYQDAEKLPDWQQWRLPSSTSPFFTEDKLQRARQRHSAISFAEEYEAEFMAGAAGYFKPPFRNWYVLGENYALGNPDNLIPIEKCWRFSSMDLAWSLDDRADYTVIATWAVTPDKKLLLIDCERGRIPSEDIVSTMRKVYEVHKPGFFVVERATKQLSIIREIERSGLPVKEVRADKDKRTRALPAIARHEHGGIWFPRENWMKPLEDELLAFDRGAHDDFVDALAYAVLEVARSGGGIVAKLN